MWLTSHGVGARPWTSVGRRSHNRAGFNWLATRALPGPKNASDKYSKAVLRISVITLIRTDTTLDLSQKAEKGEGRKRKKEKLRTRRRRFYEASKARRREKQVLEFRGVNIGTSSGLRSSKLGEESRNRSQERPGRPGESPSLAITEFYCENCSSAQFDARDDARGGPERMEGRETCLAPASHRHFSANEAM